ncbi:MAG: antibiotic biosynthesis monooxygenase [Deltaproteobacteria bacterium]|nr:antibiotic biosynthesis monooxygenase [Deltaproteobacteria bacterium]
MENPANETGPLTVIVTWRVRKGREAAFEAWHHEVTEAALAFPGHMGVNVIRTSKAGQEFVVIFRFDTYEHLRAWQDSDVHRALMKKSEPLRKKEPAHRLESGLEFWFTQPGPASPPRWKMALVTILGVWPASLLLSWLLNPLSETLPAVLKAFLMACGLVVLLTWVIMPLLVKILGRWL